MVDTNISKNMSIYLNNVFNFKHVNGSLSDAFSYVFDEIILGQRLSINFKKTFDRYPRYPYHYKYINATSSFNLLKIKQVTLDSVDKLIDSIDSDTISLKPMLDEFPVVKNDLIYDINLQITYFTDQKNLYDYLKFFLNYYRQSDYENPCYHLMGSSFDINNDTCEFSQQVVMMYYLIRLIPRLTNFARQISDYMINREILTVTGIVSSFNSFISSQQDDISSHLCQIICRNVYNMIDMSDVVIDLVKGTILENIEIVKTKFEDFLVFQGDTLASDIDRDIRNCIYHVIMLNLIREIADSGQNVLNNTSDSNFSDVNGNSEETIISEYLSQVTEYNIKQFMFLSYLYKFWPIKFINVLSIILKNFTERKIVLSSDSYLTDASMKSYIQYFKTNCIDFTELSTLLQDLSVGMTSANISDWINEYEVVKFAIAMRFIKLFDKFLDSTKFEDIAVQILTEVQNTLRENGYIRSDLNYYTGFYLVKLYFKTLLRSKLYADGLFDDLFTDVEESLESVFSDSYPSAITGEVPAGVINDTNNVFLSKYQFDDVSLVVYVNGLPTMDFTCNGGYHQIVLNTPPTSGDVITIDYTIYYELTYDYSESTLISEFTKYINSSVSINEVKLFHSNFYLGSVTKQIYYNVLNYFRLG